MPHRNRNQLDEKNQRRKRALVKEFCIDHRNFYHFIFLQVYVYSFYNIVYTAEIKKINKIFLYDFHFLQIIINKNIYLKLCFAISDE